jgi:hypothetical protein
MPGKRKRGDAIRFVVAKLLVGDDERSLSMEFAYICISLLQGLPFDRRISRSLGFCASGNSKAKQFLILPLHCPFSVHTMTSFQDRIGWVRRMPLRWKLLFSSQVAFMAFAVGYRQRIIDRRQRQLELHNEQQLLQNEQSMREPDGRTER